MVSVSEQDARPCPPLRPVHMPFVTRAPCGRCFADTGQQQGSSASRRANPQSPAFPVSYLNGGLLPLPYYHQALLWALTTRSIGWEKSVTITGQRDPQNLSSMEGNSAIL